MPCYKLELRFNRDDMIKRFLGSGFYFSVIEPGDVGVGSQVEVLDRDLQLLSYKLETDVLVDQPQQMVFGNLIFQAEVVEQRF